MLGFMILAFFAANFVAQFFVGKKVNENNGQRELWWVYVLFLGWLGVIILACLSKKYPDENVKVVYVQAMPNQDLSN